jgi:DNA-directed RNA polymerase I, II, and III subunit RPABC2
METLDIEDVDDNGQIFTEDVDDIVEPIDDKKIQSDRVINNNELNEIMNKQVKTTMPILTKYERARLIGFRATQLARGSRPTVDIGNLTKVEDIARKELEDRRIPLIVVRPIPNKDPEYWRIEEFESI